MTPPVRRRSVGYARLVSGPAPAAMHGSAPIEFERIYVRAAWHRRGVAQLSMSAVIAVARSRGAETLWLGVWARDPGSVPFHPTYGFARVGERRFVPGRDVQADWLLARPPGEAPEAGTTTARAPGAPGEGSRPS